MAKQQHATRSPFAGQMVNLKTKQNPKLKRPNRFARKTYQVIDWYDRVDFEVDFLHFEKRWAKRSAVPHPVEGDEDFLAIKQQISDGTFLRAIVVHVSEVIVV